MDLQCKNKLNIILLPSWLIIELVITIRINYLNKGKHVAFHPMTTQCNMHKCEE